MTLWTTTLLALTALIAASGCHGSGGGSGSPAENAISKPRACGTLASTSRLRIFEVAHLLFLPRAEAGTWGPDESTLTDLANDSTNQLMNMQILGNVRSTARSTSPARSGGNVEVSLGAAPAKSVSLELAELYPSAQQKQAEAYFCSLLKAGDMLQSQAGLKPYDLAGGLAAFVAGNFMAYTGRNVSDADFKALALQLKTSLSTNRNLASAARPGLGRMYEQLVIYGMNTALLAREFQQLPNPQALAQLKLSSKSQLEAIFGVSADKVDINSKGAVILP